MQIKVPVTKEKNIFKPSLEHWRTIPVEKSWEVLKILRLTFSAQSFHDFFPLQIVYL